MLHTKILQAKKNLSKNLFLLHPTLRSALLEMNKLNTEIVFKKRLVHFDDEKTLELTDFVNEQKAFVETAVTDIIKPWQQSIREIVENASRQCLKECGFEVATSDNPIEPRKLSFTEQAARRAECRLLNRFVKLGDYMMVTTLQYLAISSIQLLLKYTFRGCQDGDVVIDDEGVGTVVISEFGTVQSFQKNGNATESAREMSTNEEEDSVNTGVQVGGVVVGREVGTVQLLECGFDGFNDILSRLITAAIPRIELKEVIEEVFTSEMSEAIHELVEVAAAVKKADDPSKWKNTEKFQAFVPLFRTELLMKDKQHQHMLFFSSSISDYLAAIDLLLKVYLTTVEQVSQLTNSIEFLDPSNLPGGSFAVVRGLDDPEYGDGPQVGLIILEGGYFKELCGRIRGVFVGMFSNAAKWLSTLDPLRQMWVENQSFDVLASLRSQVGELAYMHATSNNENNDGGAAAVVLAAKARLDQIRKPAENSNGEETEPVTTDLKHFNVLKYESTAYRNADGLIASRLVDFFEHFLRTFSSQKSTMSAIPERSVINNLLIDSTHLKSILAPSPERRFDEVAKLLPGLARDKNELLLTEIQTWFRTLKTQPINVEGFVEYLDWIERSIIF